MFRATLGSDDKAQRTVGIMDSDIPNQNEELQKNPNSAGIVSADGSIPEKIWNKGR